MALRRGEKGILLGGAAFILLLMGWRVMTLNQVSEDKGIPYYTTANDELMKRAGLLMRKYECNNCHSLWTKRSIMQSVPAPALDGMGSLKTEAWLYEYFSAPDPQQILPSRLKPEFRMPSYAHLPDSERKIIASYLASLKVEDWYLEETRKREYEKLTGKDYSSDPVSEQTPGLSPGKTLDDKTDPAQTPVTSGAHDVPDLTSDTVAAH